MTIQEDSVQFALQMFKQIPRDDAQAFEAHVTAVLILFWGALWGTLGTEFARGFIEAQLRGMEDGGTHDVFTEPNVQ